MSRLRILLILVLLPLLGMVAQGRAARDTVRILAIGNSFSQDAVEQYLAEMAIADGRAVIIGNMYIGGCTLQRHVENARSNKADYAYRKIGTDAVKVETVGVSLETALADEPWDYVSFQEASPISGIFENYEKWLPELVAYVRERVDRKTKFMIHQTWAYAKDSSHSGFANYDNDQDKMYSCIVDAYNRAADLVGIRIIIPSGTAIQNGRTSFIGDNFNRDGYHLDLTVGRFTAACTWYEKLFGKVRSNDFVPEGLSAPCAEVARRSAAAAVRHPDKVTQIPAAQPEE